MPITNCARNCWIAGAVLGLLVWLGTTGFGQLRWFEGLFLGLIATGLMGRFLIWFRCEGTLASAGDEWKPAPGSDEKTEPEMAVSSLGFAEIPEARLQDVGPSGDARLPASATSHAVSDRNDIYSGRKNDAEAEGTIQSNTADEISTASDGSEPSDTAGEPDDLKEIKGVGPKLEELLNQNGVTRFAQIAEWGETEMDHFAELIGRMGSRIRGDDWVGQARILAEGGETEFSKRVDKGDVY